MNANTSQLFSWCAGPERVGQSPDDKFYSFETMSGSLSAVNLGEGLVWRFDKPSTPSDPDDYRCEANGVVSNGARHNFFDGERYTFSWSSKFSSVDNVAGRPFVIFQWKSFSGGHQNYPFLLRVNNGRLELIHATPGDDPTNVEKKWLFIWSTPVQADVWQRIQLAVQLSTDRELGYLLLNFNGSPQAFAIDQDEAPDPGYIFKCRTLDTTGNTPKWGFYNRGVTEHALIHQVRGLNIRQS